MASTLVTQWQPGLERHLPNGMTPTSRPLRTQPPEPLTAQDRAWPRSSARNLRPLPPEQDQDPEVEHSRAAGEHQEGGTRANQRQDTPRTTGTKSPPPCPSSSRTITAKNQDKSSATKVARILRCATELIKKLEAAGRCQKTEAAKATGEAILTNVPPKSKSPNSTGPEEPTKPRAPTVHTMTKRGPRRPPRAKYLTPSRLRKSGAQLAWPGTR